VHGCAAATAAVLVGRRRAWGGTEVAVPGSISLKPPRVVAEMSKGNCWFPDLLKFSTGELMLNHSLNSDSNENQHNSQAYYLSTDGGKSFDFAYDFNGFHNGGGEPRVSLPDGRIVGTSTYLRPDPAGQSTRFAAHRFTFDKGGRRYHVEPWAAKVEGLPQDVQLDKPGTSRTWWGRINWFSDILPLAKDRWLATLSLRYAGDNRERTVALECADEGYTWRYVSQIAGPDDVADATEGFDEPCMVQLKDGDVMCVSRVGAGFKQKLARAYSADGGKTWSTVDRLEAWSVAPQILRLHNGTLVLSTGRPGIFLWFSQDGRGKDWRRYDLLEHHNITTPPPLHIAHGERLKNYEPGAVQTTAYTAMVEVSPNRVMMVYDRSPAGWHSIPKGDRGQIFLLEFNVDD
jgi:hypothetical protein